ncbi:2,4-dienoyl-CoA reductase-like NADH-dependent reductase (Old Yellow Enzyme family) [Neisseria sp. HSC-16F19]|nr:NADH-dependent flavin oxidoreductase [Neisseria sp. HSC-16F19]MCP2041603.1 2,4-dienoyl-CoA reductase-like NADH-dependent reductase (Old Yellow Enzyme family) [Neisseria sp. HSC-16F19]
MNPKFQPLFQPYTFNNGVTVPNRLVVAPMTHWASHEDGSLSADERLFLQERFRGFGLFVSAATLVSPEGKAFSGQPAAMGEQDLPSLRAIAALAHEQGAKALLQLHHGGLKAVPELLHGAAVVAPSGDTGGARALDGAEIQALVVAFARAADLALRAGFDGVEIHGANQYLLQQFYSAATNRRQDAWGGSREARMRFPLAVADAVLAVRAQHQRPDFIVGYRFSPEEPGEFGLTMQDSFALIDALAQRPLQYLHVSLWDFYKTARRGADPARTRIEQLHAHLNSRLSLIGVGNLRSAEDALAAYQTGWAEFIALGKAVMLNPDWAEWVQDGREQDIVTELDPQRADRYRIPPLLWSRCLEGMDWLPPLKGNRDWRPRDI